jgi:hypothetical protein
MSFDIQTLYNLYKKIEHAFKYEKYAWYYDELLHVYDNYMIIELDEIFYSALQKKLKNDLKKKYIFCPNTGTRLTDNEQIQFVETEFTDNNLNDLDDDNLKKKLDIIRLKNYKIKIQFDVLAKCLNDLLNYTQMIENNIMMISDYGYIRFDYKILSHYIRIFQNNEYIKPFLHHKIIGKGTVSDFFNSNNMVECIFYTKLSDLIGIHIKCIGYIVHENIHKSRIIIQYRAEKRYYKNYQITYLFDGEQTYSIIVNNNELKNILNKLFKQNKKVFFQAISYDPIIEEIYRNVHYNKTYRFGIRN